MCGRFTQNYTWSEVHAFLSVFGAARNLRPRYNIAPTTTVDVVRLDREGRRELVSMRWGLVPLWWQKALKSAAPRGRFRDLAVRRGRSGGAAAGGGKRLAGMDRGPAGEPHGRRRR